MSRGGTLRRHPGPSLLVGGAVCAALGSYFGNAAIAASHVLLIGGMGFLGIREWRRRRGADAAGCSAGSSGSSAANGGQETHRRFPALPWSAWILLGLTVWCGVTIALNVGRIGSEFDSVKKLRYLVIPVAFLASPWFYGWFLRGWRIRRSVVYAWMLALMVASSAGLIAHFTGFNPILWAPPPDPVRVSGLFGQAMTYGYSMQLSVLLLGAVVVGGTTGDRRMEIPRWVWLVVFLVGAAGLYFSYDRGAMLGTIVGALLFTTLYSKRLILVVVFIGIAVGSVAWVTEARYFSFVRGDAVSEIRSRLWETAGLTFLENPVAGVGYLNFQEVCAENKERYGMAEDNVYGQVYFASHAHSNYLEMFASTGAVGGIGFLWFCGQWCREVGRSRRVRVFFLPPIVAFLVSGLFECTFTDSEVLHFLMLIYVASQLALLWEREPGGARMRTLETSGIE